MLGSARCAPIRGHRGRGKSPTGRCGHVLRRHHLPAQLPESVHMRTFPCGKTVGSDPAQPCVCPQTSSWHASCPRWRDSSEARLPTVVSRAQVVGGKGGNPGCPQKRAMLSYYYQFEEGALGKRQEAPAPRPCFGGGKTFGRQGPAGTCRPGGGSRRHVVGLQLGRDADLMHGTNTRIFFGLHKPVDQCGTTRVLSTRRAGRPDLSLIRGHHATPPAHSPLPLASH